VTPLAALVPAAGRSERMGCEKATLKRKDGTTFVSYLINFYTSFGCNPVVVVLHEKLQLPELRSGSLITVLNINPEKGRSWSIALGMKQIREGSACFLHNIDNPFVEKPLLDRLMGKLKPGSYVVPVFQGHGGHPVLLGPEIVSFFQKSKKVTDFRETLKNFERIETEYEKEQILWNINTPEAYKKRILNL